MIRVTVELLPYGMEDHKETLGVAYIANDGTGTQNVGNYNVEFMKHGGKGLYKRTRVEGFPRRRLLAWDLLYRALQKIVGHRNEDLEEEAA